MGKHFFLPPAGLALSPQSDDFGQEQAGQPQLAGRMIDGKRDVCGKADANGDHSHLPAGEAFFVERDVGVGQRLIDHQHVHVVGRLAIAGDNLTAGRFQGFAPRALAVLVPRSQQNSYRAAHNGIIIAVDGPDI